MHRKSCHCTQHRSTSPFACSKNACFHLDSTYSNERTGDTSTQKFESSTVRKLHEIFRRNPPTTCAVRILSMHPADRHLLLREYMNTDKIGSRALSHTTTSRIKSNVVVVVPLTFYPFIAQSSEN